ncbi:FkbM family methyltransferase [Streptomyces sp. SDr-06]|uniref:FkbM family methyltransferase n=1 Tax=Streptomyces sp. SDr-06 TaxID=2267702 RepID=UPI0016760F80|nr:FkbM family methyltransferase [Streptomyces sp. SDr-06]
MITTLLRRLRRAVRRLGVDVVRHRPGGHELVRLLARYEIDLVLDVGAHRGDFGTLLREAGYRGRIVSFEPLREPRAELRHRAALDDTWSVLPYALGDRTGTAPLNISGNAGPASSFLPMLPRHRAAAPRTAYTGDVIVETRRLDEVWEQVTAPGERVFLALDVQGYEAQVLDGAGELADEICGVRIGAPLVPLFEGGRLFDELLALARERLGLTLMSLEPGFTDPREGRMLQCALVLLREDAAEPLGASELVPAQAAPA